MLGRSVRSNLLARSLVRPKMADLGHVQIFETPNGLLALGPRSSLDQPSYTMFESRNLRPTGAVPGAGLDTFPALTAVQFSPRALHDMDTYTRQIPPNHSKSGPIWTFAVNDHFNLGRIESFSLLKNSTQTPLCGRMLSEPAVVSC
jgi:hypothetical protein